MRNLIMFFALIAVSAKAYSQIGTTLSDLKEEHANNYEVDYTGPNENGDKSFYLLINKNIESEHSGEYLQTKVFYFLEDKPDALCYMWKIFEPITETNPNVIYLNKEMVKIEEMLWKDYVTDLYYKLEVENGLCIVTCYPDLNN